MYFSSLLVSEEIALGEQLSRKTSMRKQQQTNRGSIAVYDAIALNILEPKYNVKGGSKW